MKIGICIPVFNTIPDHFFVNFIARIQELKGIDYKIYTLSAQPVDRARNQLVQMALDDNMDYILFIDSDILFWTGYIEELIKMAEKGAKVASGLYFQKRPPYVPMVMKLNEDGTHSVIKDIEDKYLMTDTLHHYFTVEVDAVGLGFCIIKAEIFKQMPYPWFKFEWKNSECVCGGMHGLMYNVGEDVYFCNQLNRLGIKITLNKQLICMHYGIPLDLWQHLGYNKK